jgi:hypothetical protein
VMGQTFQGDPLAFVILAVPQFNARILRVWIT